jgi:hypothetical protein
MIGLPFFESGKADLSPSFHELLDGKIAEQLKDMVSKYDVDVIEVIGHTDEQPLAPKLSNLDTSLLTVLRGRETAAELVPTDNAGLGMARAVAVAQVLMANPALNSLRILPLSGAQLITTGDVLTTGVTGDVPERRRIEIRVRRHAVVLKDPLSLR